MTSFLLFLTACVIDQPQELGSVRDHAYFDHTNNKRWFAILLPDDVTSWEDERGTKDPLIISRRSGEGRGGASGGSPQMASSSSAGRLGRGGDGGGDDAEIRSESVVRGNPIVERVVGDGPAGSSQSLWGTRPLSPHEERVDPIVYKPAQVGFSFVVFVCM